MSRCMLAIGFLIVVGLLLLPTTTITRYQSDNPQSVHESMRELGPGGVLIRRADVFQNASVAYAQSGNTACDQSCGAGSIHPWAPDFVWALFHVEPSLGAPPTRPPSPTPPATPNLRWQEHTTGNFPPVVVKVAWDDYIETMEILPDGTVIGNHNNILFHDATAVTCSGDVSKTARNGAGSCYSSFDFDIDWNDIAGPEADPWSWIYFWVRDPDFVSMKAVDVEDCPTEEWQYEYINDGPKYSICQDFSTTYNRSHGSGGLGIDVYYTVQYEEGVPPTATSGPTTTPPAGETPSGSD